MCERHAPLRHGWRALALLLAGCAVAVPPSEARYAGTLTGCGAPVPATLTRLGPTIAFAPGDGALVLHGTVATDGTLHAELNTQPPGKPPFLLTVSGRLEAAAATLSYATPRCHTALTLPRAE